MTTQRYQQASEQFLAQARQELSDGDLAQASEKGWGTAAQILKAIAEQRGWEHNRHRHYLRIASRLRAETGDGDIRRLTDVAWESFRPSSVQIVPVALQSVVAGSVMVIAPWPVGLDRVSTTMLGKFPGSRMSVGGRRIS